MKIDLNKKYTYRNGEPARILCVDAPGEWPVRSMNKAGEAHSHDSGGSWTLGGYDHEYDLIEIPEAREPREGVVRRRRNGKIGGDFPGLKPGESIRVREIPAPSEFPEVEAKEPLKYTGHVRCPACGKVQWMHAKCQCGYARYPRIEPVAAETPIPEGFPPVPETPGGVPTVPNGIIYLGTGEQLPHGTKCSHSFNTNHDVDWVVPSHHGWPNWRSHENYDFIHYADKIGGEGHRSMPWFHESQLLPTEPTGEEAPETEQPVDMGIHISASYPPPESEWPEKPDPGPGMVWERQAEKGRTVCSEKYIGLFGSMSSLGWDSQIGESWDRTVVFRAVPAPQDPASFEDERFWRQCFLASLSGIISNPNTGSDEWDGTLSEAIVSSARRYADEAIRAGTDLAAKNGLGEKPIQRWTKGHYGWEQDPNGLWVSHEDHLAAIQALTGKGGSDE